MTQMFHRGAQGLYFGNNPNPIITAPSTSSSSTASQAVAPAQVAPAVARQRPVVQSQANRGAGSSRVAMAQTIAGGGAGSGVAYSGRVLGGGN